MKYSNFKVNLLHFSINWFEIAKGASIGHTIDGLCSVWNFDKQNNGFIYSNLKKSFLWQFWCTHLVIVEGVFIGRTKYRLNSFWLFILQFYDMQ